MMQAQQALNRATAGNRALFESHRSRLMDLVETHAPARGQLALIGAGNCNDYDLVRLASGFGAVRLFDVDCDAVERGVRLQGVSGRVQIQAPADVGGIGEAVEILKSEGDAAVSRAIVHLENGAASEGPGEFDLVVSAGVLTQVIRSVCDVQGEDHARTGELAVAVRSGHIRSLLGLARPGGRVLLVTEVVSSEVLPEISTVPENELPLSLHRAIWKGDLFTGVSPAALVSWLVANRPYGARLSSPGVIGPWRWQQSPGREFLMVGFLLERPA